MKQKILPAEAIEHKTFPRAPRAAYHAAEGCKRWLTLAIGPWMDVSLTRVLEENCPSIMLWAQRPDGEKMWALWLHRSGSWKFEGARCASGRLTSKEMTAWLSRR